MIFCYEDPRSCGLRYRVVLFQDTNVSEDLGASMFRVKMWVIQSYHVTAKSHNSEDRDMDFLFSFHGYAVSL